jgi:2-oxoisovalerate dehydrogenase E1 component
MTQQRLSKPDLSAMYRDMARIRAFEERAAQLFRDGEVPGFLHLSIGQEAVAVGVMSALRREDVITSTHRGHGHVLAKGADLGSMMAELLGRETGTCAGRGGSMHIADVELGIFGANGIVGAGPPIANGAALAARLRGSDNVAVAFFGDGAISQGSFYEAVVMARSMVLPVLFVCENNQYSEFTNGQNLPRVSVEQQTAGFGLPFAHVDGNDVQAVSEAAASQIAAIREGAGPRLLEALTLRVRGHYEGDSQAYRDEGLDLEWKERDPLALAEGALIADGAREADIAQIREEAGAEVDAAVEGARAAPEPLADELMQGVSVPVAAVAEDAEFDESESVRSIQAVRAALRDALVEDSRVFIAGIDVARGGNVFTATKGLYDQFPDRVLDTPISESAIVGLGVGAALAGMRPVVEVMYLDFVGVCLDQLMNQAAKLRYMTGGNAEVPLTVRTQFGAGRSSGAQHSQSLEALLAHIPGLKVVMPGTPADLYGLLRSAIDDPNPVIVIENRILYGATGPPAPAGHRVPIGKAKVVREGTDVTLVSVSRMVSVALEAAEALAAEDGISAEVIDLRTVSPLDRAAILESIAKTGRLVVCHEAVTDFGIGAEIAATVADAGVWDLDGPVRRVGSAFSPAPYAPSLEKAWLPDAEGVRAAARETLGMPAVPYSGHPVSPSGHSSIV